MLFRGQGRDKGLPVSAAEIRDELSYTSWARAGRVFMMIARAPPARVEEWAVFWRRDREAGMILARRRGVFFQRGEYLDGFAC